MRGLGSALTAGVFVCTLAGLAAPASARQNQHPPLDVPDGDIKVHGHWVIDVRNPDGTPAARREFDNALTESGKFLLTQMLLRAYTAGPWLVALGSVTGSGPCAGPGSGLIGPFASADCFAAPQSLAGPASLPTSAFPTLTIAVGGATNSQLILAGHITANTSGQIDRVGTWRAFCAGAAVAPADCQQIGTLSLFSAHALSAAIPVLAGQIVQVTVTFSFCGSEGCQS
jgi:hypothetical protein